MRKVFYGLFLLLSACHSVPPVTEIPFRLDWKDGKPDVIEDLSFSEKQNPILSVQYDEIGRVSTVGLVPFFLTLGVSSLVGIPVVSATTDVVLTATFNVGNKTETIYGAGSGWGHVSPYACDDMQEAYRKASREALSDSLRNLSLQYRKALSLTKK